MTTGEILTQCSGLVLVHGIGTTGETTSNPKTKSASQILCFSSEKSWKHLKGELCQVARGGY